MKNDWRVLMAGALWASLTLLIVSGTVCAQEPGAAEKDDTSSAVGIILGETHTSYLKVGLRIKAGGQCQGITASCPIPMDWPEQQVQIVHQEISPEVRNVSYRTLDDGVKQMLLTIPRINPGDTVEAVLTLAIQRQVIVAPSQPELFSIPKTPEKSVRKFLGDSPFIESRNGKIRTLARKLQMEHKDAANDWERVKAIYDYVREHVEYRESELKGAVDTLADGQGDCEAMTSLFIALCRANKIPARMVWVKDHSYPEFYLVDGERQGHWFPCQISGSEAFGSMPEVRPILQKGDNYRIPETKERRRYVAVQLNAKAVRGGSPVITEILEATNAP